MTVDGLAKIASDLLEQMLVQETEPSKQNIIAMAIQKRKQKKKQRKMMLAGAVVVAFIGAILVFNYIKNLEKETSVSRSQADERGSALSDSRKLA
jgi:cytoskeletal protein RodZ